MLPTLVITSGEPAGIGPDLCLALARKSFPARLVVLGNRALLEARARMLGESVTFANYPAGGASGTLEVINLPLARECHAGSLDPANAGYVLAMLDRAIDGCMAGEFAAMVTAP
jgi:4-hydroxythreonine-4-phosphate dehydrogenase